MDKSGHSTDLGKLLTILALLLVLTLTSFSQGTYRAITGVIGDTKCNKNHKISETLTAAACVNACVTAGAKYALISDGIVYVIEGDSPELKNFAGQEATVYGAVLDKTIRVAAVTKPKPVSLPK